MDFKKRKFENSKSNQNNLTFLTIYQIEKTENTSG